MDDNIIIMDGPLSLRRDWKDYVQAVTAPGNYKDPVKIEEYIKAKSAALEEEVFENCPSLLESSYVEMWVHGWLDTVPYFARRPEWESKAANLDELAERILKFKDPLFIGSKALLYALFSEPRRGAPSKFIPQVRFNLFTGKYTVKGIEEFRFPSMERKYILAEKLIPPRGADESYIDYCKRLFDYWGMVNADEWKEM